MEKNVIQTSTDFHFNKVVFMGISCKFKIIVKIKKAQNICFIFPETKLHKTKLIPF